MPRKQKAIESNEMRMNAKEFDRIMGQALRVKPDEKPKQVMPTKPKSVTSKIPSKRKGEGN